MTSTENCGLFNATKEKSVNHHITEGDLCAECGKVNCECIQLTNLRIRLIQKVHGITIVCPWFMPTLKDEEFDDSLEGWAKP